MIRQFSLNNARKYDPSHMDRKPDGLYSDVQSEQAGQDDTDTAYQDVTYTALLS